MFERLICVLIIGALVISCNNKDQKEGTIEKDRHEKWQNIVDLDSQNNISSDIKNNIVDHKFDEVADEYIRYFSNIGFFTGKIVVNNGYLFFLDYLHDTDLAVLTKDELKILRNTIFAKHGMIFQSKDLSDHFSKFDWYKPQNKNIEEHLTDAENWLIDRIQSFENAEPNNELQKNDLIGTWLGMYPVAAGDYNNIIFDNDTVRFGYNTMYPQAAFYCNGTYEIKDGFLVVSITDQRIFIGDYFHFGYGSVIGGMDGGNKIAQLIFNDPIIMIFPVSNLKEDYYGYNIGDTEIRKIGSMERVKD